MKRRSFFHSLSLTLAAPMVASAQPGLADRPIRLIVPVAPGGSQDIVARLLARHMAGPLGQSIVVENHPAARTKIG